MLKTQQTQHFGAFAFFQPPPPPKYKDLSKDVGKTIAQISKTQRDVSKTQRDVSKTHEDLQKLAQEVKEIKDTREIKTSYSCTIL